MQIMKWLIAKWLIATLLCFTCTSPVTALSEFTQSKSSTHVISEIPAGGIVISSPGTYLFKKNIKWHPSGNGQAILITANDVTLDLQDHTLKSATTQFNTTGVLATAVSNLVIKNGTIKNMAYKGVECDGCTNLLIKNITVDGLNLENTAVYTVPVGILASSSSNVVIEKCKVKNIDVKTGSLAAIQLTATISSKVSDCHVKNLNNKDGACTGIGHLACDQAVVDSCTVDKLKAEFIDNLNTEGHTAIGLVPVTSTNLLIQNCKVSNITGCCDDAHGMSIFECLNAQVKNCKVENVLDGAGKAQTGAKATGIEIYATGVQVIDCKVKNITAINPQDQQASGFSVAQCAGVTFSGCHAEDVNVVDEHGKHNPLLGYGTGFGWAPDPRPEFLLPAVGIFYKECTAKRCQVGFDSWFHIASVWEDIHSICNEIPVLNRGTYKRTFSCNPCSECGCMQVGCFPAPNIVTVYNVASNNTFWNVETQQCGD